MGKPREASCSPAAGFRLCLWLVNQSLVTGASVNFSKLILVCLPAIICSACGEALTEREQNAKAVTDSGSKLRFLAEAGHAECQTTLAHYYCDLQQYKEAMKWYRSAAKQGDAMALNKIGDMYRFGTGVPQDDAEAVKWYLLSTEQNLSMAEYNLAMMYYEGTGVPQDYAESLRLFYLAAEGEMPVRCRRLVRCIEVGKVCRRIWLKGWHGFHLRSGTIAKGGHLPTTNLLVNLPLSK